ncbi:MAG: nicotinate phosphoribosyltransferase [Defluviitaleaceae bacterium]|nr:nicotinate phosphoribosyltransferase [Defluviitaleaceae bacterium]
MINTFSPLFTDFYELVMMQGFLKEGRKNQIAIFDLFYRSNPLGHGYAIFAGLAQVIEYLKNLKFEESDIRYLRSLNKFDEDFLEYLRDFKFSGTIHSVTEGSVVFPGEPLVKVTAPIMECQLIEGMLLNTINHQSLIATKASRIVQAAANDQVVEFGLRRAQSTGAAIYGARAAIIGGCSVTSNVQAGKMFGLQVAGTHSHSWVLSFPTELEAFRSFAKLNPGYCILLVDTYNTLQSGVPNAIKVFDELREQGLLTTYGIRLDSGDLAYLSKKARQLLDAAGHKQAVIAASNDLDENLIADLRQQGSKITLWGIGTHLITSSGQSSFGGVYKMAAIQDEKGQFIPKIKISESPEKINNPGDKNLIRLYDAASKKIKADLITLSHEKIDTNEDLTIFHPTQTWKKMTLKKGEFYIKDLLVKIVDNGQIVYKSPSAKEIRAYAITEKESLWDEFKRITKPHILPVDLSDELHKLKHDLIDHIYTTSQEMPTGCLQKMHSEQSE